MKKRTTIGIGLIFGYLASGADQLPDGAVTIRVLSESRTPLSGIEASVTFDQPKIKPNQWGSPDVESRKGKTDSNGLFTATLASGNHVAFGARCDGRYASRGSLDFARSQNGRWQPWNPTVDLVLKKVVNPIPMYARRIQTDLPKIDEPIGFDLIESDWVAPNGRGISSDLFFKLSKHVESFRNFNAELVVTFSNTNDGIQEMPIENNGSQLRSPYNAPATGYVSSLSLPKGNSKENGRYGMTNLPRDYVIRSRSSMDSKGQVVSALYGKIYGDLEYFPVSHKTAKLRFAYYVNPTPNDRNIEFDPKRNLFTNLKPEERVTEP